MPTHRGMYSFLGTGDKFTSLDKGRKRFCLKSHKCHTTYRGPEDHLTDQSEAVQRPDGRKPAKERPGERTCDPEVLSTTPQGVGQTTPSTTMTRENGSSAARLPPDSGRQTPLRLGSKLNSILGLSCAVCVISAPNQGGNPGGRDSQQLGGHRSPL